MACDGSDSTATIESIVSNARHALGDGDAGETTATIESIVSNARHALGYVDGGEATVVTESIVSNARHSLGDNGGRATLNQGVAACLYDGIASVT